MFVRKLKQTKVPLAQRIKALGLVLSLAVFLPFSVSVPTAAQSVDELRQRSNELLRQIQDNNARLSDLSKQANTLQKKLNELNAQIAQLNAQLELTQIKITELEDALVRTQAELDRQKGILRASMRALYKRGGASTLELLAAADSFSEFMNEQEYLERIKAGVQTSAEKVVQLKADIQTQKTEQEALKLQQEAQRALVQQSKNEQARLLADTRGEEARYQAINSQLKDEQARLLAQIVARSRVLSGVGTGNYPWADYREGRWTHGGSCNYGDDIDPWGYCYRQCVSYAAWRLYAEGKEPPKYYGNATYWGSRARANGHSTGSEARVGAIAVWTGYEGHVAYVEEVLDGGTQARISEYNAVPALQGRYSQRIIDADDPSTYIYF